MTVSGPGRRRSGDPNLLGTELQHFRSSATCPDYLINSERTKEEGIPEEGADTDESLSKV